MPLKFIDYTYFNNIEIQLPRGMSNQVLLDNGPRIEEELIEAVLGYALKKIIYSSSETERVNKIINGSEYSDLYEGKTILLKWKGLKNTDKVSPVAYYCYTKLAAFGSSTISGIGEAKPNAENSINTDQYAKIVNANNTARDLMGFYGQPKNIPSLYNFLHCTENKDLYPELVFTPLKYINPMFL